MAAAKKKEKKPIKTGASSGHLRNLKQSILVTFDIYDANIYSYLETSVGQSCILYLNAVHFINTSVN
jgi:hypothetical protein